MFRNLSAAGLLIVGATLSGQTAALRSVRVSVVPASAMKAVPAGELLFRSGDGTGEPVSVALTSSSAELKLPAGTHWVMSLAASGWCRSATSVSRPAPSLSS